MNAPTVAHLLLIHLPPSRANAVIQRLRPFCVPPSELLVCYGGTREDFNGIEGAGKMFIDDPRLRTRHNQADKQSYTRIFQQAAPWLEARPALRHVYVGEFDHLPVVDDFHARLVARMERERADVLAHELCRRDGTSCPYTLHQMSEPRFVPWLEEISRRRDPKTVLVMLGTGSFWTREAFLAVARREEPFPMYLELYLPTLAHHLGFRVRDFEEQNRYVTAAGERSGQLDEARAAGAWSVHPVKKP